MLAEILTIGDELCRGEIVDTNSTWFAEHLWDIDIAAAWMTSCRDVRADMLAAFELAASRSQLVVVSGGLGATEDDLTVDVISELIGCEPIVDQEALLRWRERYRQTGREPTSKTDRQLRVPADSIVHQNQIGAAPGFEVEYRGVPIVCMPGIPREVESIWNGGLSERLTAMRDARGKRVHIARRTFRVFGRGESDISSMLDGLLDGDGSRESIHYRVKFPEILIKLVVRRADPREANERLAVLEKELRTRLGWLVFAIDDDSLSAVLGRELAASGKTLSVAESCTGGLLGAAMTDISGSSSYFVGGAITYSNDAKISQLGVERETIEEHGAVSEQCAIEMAAGVRARLGSDVGVAITGVAGPGGGSPEKPVGTVWLAVATGENTEATKMSWPGTRDQIRRLAVFRAMALVRKVMPKAMDRVTARSDGEKE